jgi:uncharacterized membrane protein
MWNKIYVAILFVLLGIMIGYYWAFKAYYIPLSV